MLPFQWKAKECACYFKMLSPYVVSSYEFNISSSFAFRCHLFLFAALATYTVRNWNAFLTFSIYLAGWGEPAYLLTLPISFQYWSKPWIGFRAVFKTISLQGWPKTFWCPKQKTRLCSPHSIYKSWLVGCANQFHVTPKENKLQI